MNSIFKLALAAVALLFIIIYAFAGMTHISPGEVGILIKNIGDNRGMQKEVLTTGTHWIEPWTYDVKVYDARQHQTEEVNDLPAQTGDGQPVKVNFSVQLGLEAALVPVLHEKVGPDFYNQLVHPAIIQVVKNKLPSKKSDEVYTSEGREAIERAINDEMDKFTRVAIVLLVLVLVAVILLTPLALSAVKRGKERYEEMGAKDNDDENKEDY